MYSVPKLTNYSAEELDGAVAELLSAAQSESLAIHSDAEWKSFRDRWMARKNGILTQVNDLWLKAAPKEAKKDVGARVNALKNQVEEIVSSTEQRISAAPSLASERIDVTLPGIRRPLGAEHPIV